MQKQTTNEFLFFHTAKKLLKLTQNSIFEAKKRVGFPADPPTIYIFSNKCFTKHVPLNYFKSKIDVMVIRTYLVSNDNITWFNSNLNFPRS